MTEGDRNLGRRAYELFLVLMELEGPERETELLRQTEGDLELRSELRSLLASSSGSGDFLEAPALSASAGHPTRVGHFEIHEVLGEGGMGTVYLAEQTEPVRRRVALKVIKLGMDTRKVQSRFQRERQALARMSHPGIAHVFDAGTTERGQAYFAMEYVDGVPITDFCEGEGLELDARLFLFLDVCRAVEHAHTKGVLHRDLKPSNVLVSAEGGVARPRVIDFGVARAVHPDPVESITLTLANEFVGTPDYMSPEQAGVGDDEIDARSDVYSLGVLLYELVTGARPYHVESASGLGAEELRARIAGAQPPRPSRVKPGLSRELDWIVMTALASERDERYPSPLALGNDLERLLRHQPVVARAPTRLYLAAKFCQRNARALKVAAGMLVGLLVVVAVAASYLDRANEKLLQKDLDAKALLAEHRAVTLGIELAELRAKAGTLWPARLATVPRIEAWMQAAEAIVVAATSLDADAGPRLDKLKAALLDFQENDSVPDSLPGVRARMALCKSIEEESRVTGAGLWADAIAEIADPVASSLYRGLLIEPQVGLVPLGRDPKSTLQEFLVVGTGTAPLRDAEGCCVPSAEIGIVLVLIPGGTARIGSDGIEYPGAPNLEKEPFEVELDPFFLAKYELSKGQQLRMDRLTAPPGLRIPPPLDRSLPVEPINWLDGTELLARLGLQMPTEAQWECGARAGTRTPWPSGEDPTVLVDFANLFDQAAFAAGIVRDDLKDQKPEVWNDHWASMSPIGSFEPNAFGLHDVVGNVYEWCQDVLYIYDDAEHLPGTGLAVRPAGDPGSEDRVVRGGSYVTRSNGSRTAIRAGVQVWGPGEGIGLRPARRLE